MTKVVLVKDTGVGPCCIPIGHKTVIGPAREGWGGEIISGTRPKN